MGNVVQFKAKPKKDKKVADFLEQLSITKELFLIGEAESVVIIVVGKDYKAATTNSLTIGEAKEICRDFIYNTKEYVE